MKRILLYILVFTSVQSMAQQQKQLNPIPSGSYHWSDIAVNKSADREGRRFIEGTTPQFAYFEIHASTQYKGAEPRPPHTQTDIEELIYVKEGTMKFTMGPNSKVIQKGGIILIPPHTAQALQNIGDGPLTYYVIMFRSVQPMDLDRSAKAGGPLLLNADSLKYIGNNRGGQIKYIDRPTAMLTNLEAHITELKSKGPSHAPHIHPDTELIIMLQGETEITIQGKINKALAGDICLINGNEMHGISNSQDALCRYLIIRLK